MRRLRSERFSSTSVVIALLVLLASAACIIVDPPPELPPNPPHRPTIVHASVAPPATQIVGDFPLEFVVPVELRDASATFKWRVFVDYNALAGGDPANAGVSAPDPNDPGQTVRVVSFSLTPPGPERCHTIEFLVALDFKDNSSHTPSDVGGDSIVWFYNPTGDVTGCPLFDAGALADATFPVVDSGSD